MIPAHRDANKRVPIFTHEDWMSLPKIITVCIKGDDTTYKKKSLVYESFSLDFSDPVLASLIAEAKLEFKGEIEEVSIRLSMVIE